MAMVPQYLDMWKQAVDPEFREANRSCYLGCPAGTGCNWGFITSI